MSNGPKKPAKGKKVDAYKVAAGAFELLNSCPNLLYAVLRKHEKNMSTDALADLIDVHDLLQKIVLQVFRTTIQPANNEIEASSKSGVIGGKQPKREFLTRSHLIAAAEAYASGGGTTQKGWKQGVGGVVDQLRRLYPDKHSKIKRWDQVTPRLKNAGITEDEIKELIENWQPPASHTKTR